jgi:hypothetical protein
MAIPSSPGYLSQSRTFNLKPGETREADPITLERPRQVAISYRVASSPPFTKASPERQTVLGGGQFRANRQDPQGTPFDLEFPQNDGKISIRARYGGTIHDQGPASSRISSTSTQPRRCSSASGTSCRNPVMFTCWTSKT